MELKKHFEWKYLFIGLYILLFGVYVVVGLQPAQAADYEKTGELLIPRIGLDSDVTNVNLNGHRLETPETIVGSFAGAENKILLIGHSKSVFSDLDEVKLNDEIVYNGKTYMVKSITWSVKERVHMSQLLKREDEDTLVIMTCAGELLEGGDATHRLIITALIQ